MDYQIIVRYPDGALTVRSYSLINGSWSVIQEVPASQVEVFEASKRNKIYDVKKRDCL